MPPVRSWWSDYSSQIVALSDTATEVLEADCKYILEKGIFGSGDPSEGNWPDSKVRRGLVMGSVQSGKTASMFGVSALALDSGIDMIVILAGTRLSLWRQTYRRFESQMDVGLDGPAKQRRRLLVPRPGEATAPEGRLPLAALYKFEPAQVRRAIRDGRPMVVIAMKHTDHLRALGKSIREAVFPAVATSNRPFHMLVLDDEADDGSILDALVEEGEDPVYGNLKQIPRAIADLWDPRAGGPAPTNFFATYTAYTATPQSNFLQQDHNPLAPKDFIASLRTSYDHGTLIPRETTYFEPRGIKSYYTGGEIFYRRGTEAGLCLPTGDDPELDRANAVRAFLVASAIQELRSPERLGPLSAKRRIFASREEATDQSPRPQSMLIHPSAMVSDHFAVAVDLLKWAGQSDAEEAAKQLSIASGYLPERLAENLESEESLWRAWLEEYRNSAKQIRNAFDLPRAAEFPAWADVKTALVSEVIPGTRVSVVNSDPDADDRPEYEPWEDEEGWHAPRDLSTIFVSGNVMSRGLTLEGLTTTLFFRHSSNPFADSQMQMQRWFGYRGAYLELCRVIAPLQQLDFFAAYHEGDEALRQAVIQTMNDYSANAPTPFVLQGEDFLATGKIANLGNQPLCPGSKPFVRLINPGDQVDPNAGVVASLFEGRESADVVAGELVRGRILSQPLSLDDAADLIDRLRFDKYQPGAQNWQGEMWSQVQARVEIQGAIAGGGALYRPVEPKDGRVASKVRKDCPYAIGAYFRLWSACLSRHVRGLFPTESPLIRWSMVDLAARKDQQPKFWVGIRYGGGPVIEQGALAELPFDVRAAERSVMSGELVATWGSRAPGAGPSGYRGDEFFDYYHRGESVPSYASDDAQWRPVGADGLILFYVNQLEDQPYPSVAVGVSIPLGGPDQFAAVVSSARAA
jgi:hypothetical protein